VINRQLTLIRSEGEGAVFAGSVPLHRWESEDQVSERLVMVSLAQSGLAKHRHLGAAFAVHENTVARSVRRAQAGGLGALVPTKRGPKGPSKVTDQVRAEIERARAEGLRVVQVQRRVRESLGVEVSRSYMSRLRRREAEAVPGSLIEMTTGDAASREGPAPEPGSADPTAPQGCHAKVSAPVFEPPAVVPEVARGRYMGTTLYYPALEVLGLVEMAKKCFRLPNSELFGVRAVTLTLFFLTLLSQTTVEAAKHLRRFEFGPVIGAGRAPAVKTPRRKLAELVQQHGAALFQGLLAKRWVEQAVVATAYL